MNNPPISSRAASSPTANVAIGLNAVLATVDGGSPKVLCVQTGEDALGLPYGPFDPKRHRTFEIGMREWVERQTNISLGFIEQLYTFGDKGREAPAAALDGGAEGDRIISVGYLALTPAPDDTLAKDATWRDWYSFFPWEDWRGGEPNILRKRIFPELSKWIDRAKSSTARDERLSRINTAFGLGGFGWEEERTLDRYELLYEASLVFEALRDRKTTKSNTLQSGTRQTGAPMLSDHRRILATAIGRLRGKLKYRPIIFDMMGSTFTLLQLQHTIEAIVGFEFHKQNFRRSVEKSGFIENTGETTGQSGGRPAALFRIHRDGLKDRAAAGLAIPRMRRDMTADIN
ncbi:MAG: NAD regulator [Alphaproteobacteria bacterium]|nr:NAD regulator [Alphaproteobacteria bacterium]